MRTTKENIKGVYPLSPMQEGMLHHALADAELPSYMQQICWTVRGVVDCKLLEKSWNALLKRHDSLRTVFAHDGTDRPLQVVLKEAVVRVDFQDLRALKEQRRESVRHEIMVLQRTTPFNLSRDLLMRLFVIQQADDVYDVVWTHHHLLLDGWSVGILLGEFLHIYSALKGHRTLELLSPTPINGYIAWLEQHPRDLSHAFWKDQLQGFARIAEIPPSGRDLAKYKGEQGSVSMPLDSSLYGALQARAADCGVTVTVLLQCIWSVVLSRYNDCSDVVFGLVVSGRPAEIDGIETMVGNLINTVPVRVRIDHGMSWRSLAMKVQETSLLSAPHHHSSLAVVQRASALPRGLFSTIMAMESYPVDATVEGAARSGASGFVLESTTIHERTNYALDVQFLPIRQGLRCTFFYGRDLYEDSQIEALMQHFIRCATACAEAFAAAVDTVDMLGRKEAEHLLFDLKAPAVVQSEQSDQTVVELFEQQAARTPEAIALVCGEARLSYAELNRQANRFAHALIDEYGVVPGDVVGILLTRSAEYIVSILGILKAGATYLPLDPDIPERRLADMVRECRARYILLETKIVEGLAFGYRLSKPFIETLPRFTPPRPAIADLDTLPISDRSLIGYEAYSQFLGQSTARFPAAIQAAMAANPPRKAGPADAVYIIHTSGSTGKPKGVVIEHHSMRNLVGWLKRTVYSRYPSAIREATVAPLIFDVSAQQIFGAFSSGSTLYLVPGDIAATPTQLLAYLKEQRVQMVNVTPSRLAMMLDAIDQGGEPMTVDQLLVGAEKLPRALVERFYAHPGHKEIVIRNMYGPTECCVDAASWLFGIDSFRQWQHPPLGKAIDNAYFRILDRAMRPVPIGVFGELYVGGEGVAREYVNRPDESGHCFVADPFADHGRLYRTGDRVRWTTEGMIEFGGRIDNQLKVRGFRIEPEEIEKWLGRHPAVAGAAVTVLGSEGEADTLTAFVVTRSEVTVEALQDYLRTSLPAYMIPALFAKVEELPLNASGKLDRLQLRAMSPANHLHRGAASESARSEEERVLEQAWRAVLGEEHLSIHDNYFALGGDSIKAIQVVSRMARAGWAVTIRDLFRYPTIGQLAPHIVPARVSTKILEGGEDRAPLTPIQISFMQNHAVEPNRFNHAMILSSKERIDLEALQVVWDCLLASHGSLHSSFRQELDVWHQELSEDRPRHVEFHDIRDSGENSQGCADIGEGLHGSMDLASGKLAAAACIRTSNGDRILIVIHHLAVDAISWRIILEDLVDLYTKVRSGITPILPPPPVSFIQWANTLSSHAGDSRLLSQLPYWQAVAQSGDALPAALSGAGENTYHNSSLVQFELGKHETERLRLAAHRAYSTTVEDLLLCALGRALQTEHGVDSTLITLESHGREETFGLDLSRTCGWLTVTYPFALTIHAERDLAYQIKAVKESLRAVPDRGVGYGLLRFLTPQELTRSYDLSCSPAIGFNYLGRLEAESDNLFKVELGAVQAQAVNPLAVRPHLLDVSGIVIDDILTVSLSYSRQAYGAEAAQSLTEAFRAEILGIIDHCCDGRQTELTPADLTYSDLTLDELEGIL